MSRSRNRSRTWIVYGATVVVVLGAIGAAAALAIGQLAVMP